MYLPLCGGAVLSNSELRLLRLTRHAVHPLRLDPPILERSPTLLQLVSETAHCCSCPVLLPFEVEDDLFGIVLARGLLPVLKSF